MEKALIDISIKSKDLSALQQIESEINRLNEAQKKLNKTSEQYSKNKIQLAALRKEHVNLKNEILKQNTAAKANINTLGGVNAKLAELRNKIKGVEFGTAKFNKMAGQIKDLENKQRQYNKSIGRSSTFVGEYKKGFIQAFTAMGAAVFGAQAIIRNFISLIKEGIRVNREFEKGFTNVLTLLSKAEKEKYGEILKEETLDLMAKYGLEIQDVNKALFDTISNGIDAGNSIEFLDKSAKLAIAGNSELSSVVKGATKTYEVYKDEVKSVDEILNAFFVAQVKGATNVELMSNNIGKVASTAKKAGTPLNELFGIFAGLTKFLDGTEESSTALVNMINALIKVTPQAQKEFDKLGIETGITAVKQNGLLNTILAVIDATEENEDAITSLIPNIRAFKGIAGLSAEVIYEVEKNIAALNDTEQSAITVQNAYNEQMETGARQAATMKAEWQRFLITLGGGESIFKRIGNAFREYTTNRLQVATGWLRIYGNLWDKIFKRNKETIEKTNDSAIEENEKLQAYFDKLEKLKEEREKKAEENRIALEAKKNEKKEEKYKKALDKQEEEMQEFYNDLRLETEAFNEDVTSIEQESRELQKEIKEGIEQDNIDHYKKEKKEHEKAVQDFIKSEQKKFEKTTQFAQNMGVAIGQSLADANAGAKEVFKSILNQLFDFLQAQVPIWSAQILGYSLASPESVLTLGAAGIAKAAVITGLLSAGVEIARNAVAGFADSGVLTNNLGLPINRSNGDNRLITAKTGEVWLNKQHQNMLGGPSTFKAIGVPGFANSGIIGGNNIKSSLLDPENLAGLIAKELNDKKVILVMDEVYDAMNEKEQIIKLQKY